ncbi:MAG: phosphoglycerate dehydrogenase [Eubacteriales bacterium]
MFKIASLNKISGKGLDKLSNKFIQTDLVDEAQAILVRSQDMLNMELSSSLLAIARAGAGYNNIPVDTCSKRGIVVFNTPGANANAVKELVITGLLLSARNIAEAISWTKTLTTDVEKSVEKHKSQFAGHEIKGKSLGVLGLGAIGVMVANTASDLGMHVYGYDPYLSIKSAHELDSRVKFMDDLNLLLPKCDYISLHIPFSNATKGFIGKDQISNMKRGVCVLNFSRDKIVDELEILAALSSGHVKQYVTDFPNENVIGNDKVISIPHLGASTKESEDNCAIMAVEQIVDYLENGNITNSVNFPDCRMGICNTQGRIGVLNKNVPAMLGKITNALAELNINISDLNNRSKGEYAYTLIDIDSNVDEDALRKLHEVDGIIAVRIIK